MKNPVFLLFFFLLVLNNSLYCQRDNSFNAVLDRGEYLIEKERYLEALNFYTSQLKNYPKEHWADLYLNIGIVYYRMENYEEAITAYEISASTAKEKGQIAVEAAAQNNIGNSNKKLGDFETALNYYKKALESYREMKDVRNIGVNLYNAGICFKELTLYDRATEVFFEAIAVFDSLNEKGYLASVYQSLGNTLRIEEDYENSLDFHFKALELKQALKSKQGISASLNDIGNTYKELGNYEEAIRYYEQAGNMEIKTHKATIVNNIGEVYFRMGQFEKAEGLYQTSLALHEQAGDQKGVALTLTELGELYYEKGQFLEAERYLKSAVPVCEEMKYKDILLKNGETQQKVFEATGRFREANEMGKFCANLRREIFDKTKIGVINGLKIDFQTEAVKKENALIGKENQLKKYQNSILVGFVSVILVFGFFIIRNKQRSIQMEKARVHLEQSLRMDIQHRTKNFLQVMLSLSQFMKRQMKSQDDEYLVEDFQKKIDTMIVVNNSLQVKKGMGVMHTNFHVFLEELVQNLLNTIGASGYPVKTVLKLTPVHLDSKKAYPLALIANELITNALKYGLKDKNACLTVVLRVANNQFELEIGDNGSGLPEDFNPQTLNSQGFRLIDIFVAQLKGVLEVENDGGLIVRVKADKE